MATSVYEWKGFMGRFRPSRISIDFQDRTIEFENAIRIKSFWTFFHSPYVKCCFGDIIKISLYTSHEIRFVSIETDRATGVYSEELVPCFDDFADEIAMIADLRNV